jgi:hypothetical protein
VAAQRFVLLSLAAGLRMSAFGGGLGVAAGEIGGGVDVVQSPKLRVGEADWVGGHVFQEALE